MKAVWCFFSDYNVWTAQFHLIIFSLLYLCVSCILVEGRLDNEFFQQSEESSQFRQEFEMRKVKQASYRYCVVFVYNGDIF